MNIVTKEHFKESVSMPVSEYVESEIDICALLCEDEADSIRAKAKAVHLTLGVLIEVLASKGVLTAPEVVRIVRGCSEIEPKFEP